MGLPGSGKSTVGKKVAQRLGLDWVDTDQAIESRLGCAIRTFFDSQGEQAFRDVEEAVIAELSVVAGVLSTGGGAVLRPANRQRLRERGTVIYLRASPEQLYRRLRHDTKRPLLQGGDPLQKLQALHAERDPLYRECAHFTVDTRGTSLPMLVNRILMQLDLMPLPGRGTDP
ncbi:shikimate kinase [Ottowia testudinis]|uniref:Shikimate kinase n=1 Tax=Ottowia testudinis TaxID=2816950 RepID=A0A975H520_9BURK|nr:shikimate kinase [Ottowia testudinis]